MRKLSLSIMAGAAAFAIAAPASAATVYPINGPNLDTHIHASTTDTTNDAVTVWGSTASGGASANVAFTGNTQIHITDGAGFAAISDVLSNATLFTQLIVDPTPDFTQLQFSIQLNNAGSVLIEYMTSIGGCNVTWCSATGANPFTQAANTLKDYQIDAGQGELLSKIRITTSGGADLFLEKQNSITIATAAVPEPATWAMMLLGFGAAGYSLRRRKRVALQAA